RVRSGTVEPLLLVEGGSPYYFLGSHTFFYRPRRLEVTEPRDSGEMLRFLKGASKPVLFYYTELTPPPLLTADRRLAARCKLVYRNFPWGFEAIVRAGDPFLHWNGRFNARSLYECAAGEIEDEEAPGGYGG